MEPPPNHRTSQGAARIQTLTDTAALMFLEHGYEAVSIDELIAQVGGSRRNIYQHFGGKKGLFIEAITRLCKEAAKPLAEMKIEELEARLALSAFGQRVLEIILQPRSLSLHRLMIAEGARFPELAQAVWYSGHQHAINLLASWLRQRPLGEFKSFNALEMQAEQFISMLVTGPQLRSLIGLSDHPPSSDEIAYLASETVETFLTGMLKQGRQIHE
ncbi:hypothetical protein BMI90_07020 [Thioclava sp. L04-15]|nr:hypothetical protein BMI90_07020 [Thioclava sp. L04-15]